MSTPCVVTILDEDDRALVHIYKHWDGDNFGEELQEFIKDIKVVSGLPAGSSKGLANGMGCFAAQLIKHFKKEPGDVYITHSRIGYALRYTISLEDDKLVVGFKKYSNRNDN